MLWFCVSNSEVGLHYEATSQIDDVKPEQWRLDSHFLEAWGIGDVISIMGGWGWEDGVWNRMDRGGCWVTHIGYWIFSVRYYCDPINIHGFKKKFYE